MDEFYVGYLPKAPPGNSRWLKRIVCALFAIAALVAILLVFAQQPFAKSFFQYGNVQTFSGTIQERPFPALVTSSPDQQTSFSHFLLVAPGKHGASGLVSGLDGKHVKLQAQLIYRPGAGTALEVVPGSVQVLADSRLPDVQDQGKVMMTGELVDTKCYLGVMNPGSGKVHRDCATRCIAGGIPMGFVVTDAAGKQAFYVVDDQRDAQARQELLRHISEPVTLKGELLRNGETEVIQLR